MTTLKKFFEQTAEAQIEAITKIMHRARKGRAAIINFEDVRQQIYLEILEAYKNDPAGMRNADAGAILWQVCNRVLARERMRGMRRTKRETSAEAIAEAAGSLPGAVESFARSAEVGIDAAAAVVEACRKSPAAVVAFKFLANGAKLEDAAAAAGVSVSQLVRLRKKAAEIYKK